MSKRIVVIDDHDVVRQGVRLILRARSDWPIVAEGASGMEAIEKTKQLEPDLLILDISMPGKDGLEVLAELRQEKVSAQVLILTMHDSKELATRVSRLGASGYVVKTHAGRDLLRALETIFQGGTFFPHELETGESPTAEDTKSPG